MEAVAQRAGVSRMTVYNQFRSESGLLEALADHLAARGGMARMPEIFAAPDPAEAVRRFVTIFTEFWASERVLMRRLRAFGVLHPQLYQALRNRDDWRRSAAEHVVARLRPEEIGGFDRADAADFLTAVSSFETFDSLSSHGRAPEEVAGLLTRSVLSAWGLSAAARASTRRSASPPPRRGSVRGKPPS